jgi:phage repressor protein C with HTH and peptisase S24 domain
MDVKDRLKILIDLLGLKIKDFSRKTGVPYPTLLHYLNGTRSPTQENLQKIAIQTQCNLNWLLTGEGEPFIKKETKEPLMVRKETTAYEGSEFGKNYVLIPMVSGKISAGKGLTPLQDFEVELKLAFRTDWIKRKEDHTKMSLIRVEGESMEPNLYSGDIVLVDGNRNFVDLHGGIYAIYVDDSIMIKRIQLIFNEKKLKIISDNTRYEPIIVSPDDIHVIGKVIWIGREIEK